MKLKKKSGLMGAIIALSCASLVSVGFASWVISQGDTETRTGTIIVDEVNDQSHLITVNTDPADIKFVSNSTVTADKWLTSDRSDANLVASVSITVTNLNSSSKIHATIEAGTLSGSTFTPEAADNTTTGYGKAANLGYVGGLPTASIAAGSANSSVSTSWDTTITFTFAWGSYFGGNNPFDFYNGYEPDEVRADAKNSGDTYAEDAAASLSDLELILTGVNYRITISTDA